MYGNIYFVHDVQHHDFKYHRHSLYNHLLSNPISKSKVNVELIPEIKTAATTNSYLYEFLLDERDFHLEDNIISNRFDIDNLISDKKSIIIISTGFTHDDRIQKYYDDLIRIKPNIKSKVYFHTKMFGDFDFPYISTLSIDEFNNELRDDSTWFSIKGHSACIETIAIKAFAHHYQIDDQFVYESNCCDIEGNTFHQHTFNNQEWVSTEVGFKNFIVNTCPSEKFKNHTTGLIKLYGNQTRNKHQIWLDEITSPSIRFGSPHKEAYINSLGLKDNSIRVLKTRDFSSEVQYFRECFRNVRSFLNLNGSQKESYYNDSIKVSDENKLILNANSGFIGKSKNLIESFIVNEYKKYPDCIHLTNDHQSYLDVNNKEFKNLMILSENKEPWMDAFDGSLGYSSFVQTEIGCSTKLSHALSLTRRSASKHHLYYFHGNPMISEEVLSGIKSVKSKGASFAAQKKIKDTIDYVISPTYDLVTQLIQCARPKSILPSKPIRTDIKNRLNLTENDVVENLKNKNLVVPMSDYVGGHEIATFFDSHNINFIPVFCAIVSNGILINDRALYKVKQYYPNTVIFYLNFDVFYQNYLRSLRFMGNLYDACLSWMILKVNRAFIVSLNNESRQYCWHTLSKNARIGGVYQHYFGDTPVYGDVKEFFEKMSYENNTIRSMFECQLAQQLEKD